MYIYTESEQHQIPVILFANLWHDLKWSDRKKAFYLNDQRTDIDQYDITTDDEKDSDKDQSSESEHEEETAKQIEDKKLRSSIQNAPIFLELASPLLLKPTLPFPASSRQAAAAAANLPDFITSMMTTQTTTMSSQTQTQPTTQTTTQGTAPVGQAAPTLTPADVQDTLSNFLRRTPGSGSGGGGGGGGGGPPPGPPQPT